jgi:hypothetical protein
MVVEIKYRTTTYNADVFKYGNKEYTFVVTDKHLKGGTITMDEYIEECKEKCKNHPQEQVLLLCKHVKHHTCPDSWSQEAWERSLKDERNMWGIKLVDKKIEENEN